MNCDDEIMVVEDNPNDAELVLRVFKKHNLANKCVFLKDGAAALDYIFGVAGPSGPAPQHTPCVIMLDLKLPKVDGLEVLRRLKADERTRSLPVVVLTSSNQDQDIKAAYGLGVNSFVTKPVKFDEFAKVIADLGLYWMMVNVPPAK